MDIYSPSVLTAISRVSDFNLAPVNVPNVKTVVATCDMGLCVPGQLIIIVSRLSLTKGGVAGDSFHDFRQEAGTGAINLMATLAFLETKVIQHPAGLQSETVLAGIALVITAGTVFISTRGQSLGSDSTCGVGDANMVAIKFNR